MLFTTDKQTLEDLNIFGKHGTDSIFSIFNRCTTRGGAAVLEEMFRHPLSNDQAINQRSNIIRYFAEKGISFPFSATDFDALEPYLNNTDERSKLSAEDNSISKKLSNLIGLDAETAVVYRGVSTLTEMLKAFHDFVISLDLVEGDFYTSEAEAIVGLLTTLPYVPLSSDGKGKLSHVHMAGNDIIFRFRHRNAVQNLLRYIYDLDVYISVAKVAQERKFVFPKALSKNTHDMVIEGVYHPQVKNAIANSIHITPAGNVIFLTGANMAGKSTFMKSLSICLFLAHMGFPLAAKKVEFSVLDGIYTTINLPDDLGMGASHFYAEILRVKKMAKELGEGKSLFIVFDELFRGTNVKDAYEGTVAITGAFAKKNNSMFLISTHIIEAAEVLRKECPNVRFVYLPTKMKGTQPVYTYTLKEGVTDDRHGMVIINNEHILDILEAGIIKQNLA